MNEQQLIDKYAAALEVARKSVPTWIKIVIGVLVVALIVAVGFAGYQYIKPVPVVPVSTSPGQYHFTLNGPTSQPPEPKIIYVPVGVDNQTTTTTSIEQKKKDDPTDMEYRLKTNYFIDINGKKYEVQPEVKEDTKLQNNKIVMTQEGKLNIKVDVPQPIGSFGAGVNNHGELAIVADGCVWKNLNWWMYGSRTEQAGGLKVTVYK